MTLDPTLGFLAGIVLGTKPMPPEVINDLRERKPQFYRPLTIDMATARDNVEFPYEGNFISIDRVFTAGNVFIRLNEPDNPKMNLTRMRKIRGPFYRFFITNVAGTGGIDLTISRGYLFETEQIEAIDLAELAVRLGSIQSHDRRGDIIFQTSFESGIERWGKGAYGTGSVEWAADNWRNSGFSAKLTGGSAYPTLAYISLYLAYPVISKIGVEFSFAVGKPFQTNVPEQVDLYGYLYDGTNRYTFSTRHDLDLNLLYYTNSGGTRTSLDTIDVYEYYSLFHTFKVVFDPQEGKWSRIIFNNKQYDMSAIALQVETLSLAPQIYFQIANQGHSGNNDILWVDDVIVTQNEP